MRTINVETNITYLDDYHHLKRCWYQFFENNFLAQENLNNINKKHYIYASAFRELYNGDYLVNPLLLETAFLNFDNYSYVEMVWRNIIEFLQYQILYKNNLISIKQFQFMKAYPKYFSLNNFPNDFNNIKQFFDFDVKNSNGNLAKNNFNTIVVEAKINYGYATEKEVTDVNNHFIFLIPIFFDIRLLAKLIW